MTRPGLLGRDDALQELGDRQRLDRASVLIRMPRSAPMASAVRMVSLGLRRADRDDDDLARLARFLLAQRLLDRDLVERVHRHLDVGEIDARPVGLDPDLDVVVDHPFHGHEDLHGPQNSSRTRAFAEQFEAETPNLGSCASQRGQESFRPRSEMPNATALRQIKIAPAHAEKTCKTRGIRPEARFRPSPDIIFVRGPCAQLTEAQI